MGSENKQRLRSAESMARQLTEAEQEEYDRLRQKHPSASVCMWSLSMLQKLDNSEKGYDYFHSRGLFSLLAKHEESVALARGDL